ncbi:exosortase-associated protein EpsI, V-type [Sphingomonas humi]|uniref:Methanolan biosynthesis EpsI domain-containing protein n=1 Tax=Sphingomonas humi TaxID=335630 RepID=A0ABP7RQ65_9SPHN
MPEREQAEHDIEAVGTSTRGLDRRRFLIGGVMAAGAATTYARLPSKPVDYLGSRKLEKLVPKKIGSWEFLTNSGLVVPTEDTLSDSLYSQLLTRTYTNGVDPPMMLLIAQSAGQTGLLQVHRPEFCYPAGGFKLSPIVPIPLATGGGSIKANNLTATLPGRSEQIVYWTRVGTDMPLTWASQRLSVAIANLKGLIPDAVLTRVSTVDPDREAALTRLADFAETLLRDMGASKDVLISGR